MYQVVWVRVFGHVFGNTVESASLVVAIFMLGLGAGGYAVGRWADRLYAARPDSLVRAYAGFELGIAALALAVSLVLPYLAELSAFISTYTRDGSGWYRLSFASYAGRAAVAVALLTPITILMGGTLTLLIRHRVRRDVDRGGWGLAVLYGVNTLGAAAGAFLTDFVLVPWWGLRQAQWLAVGVNLLAAGGALLLVRRASRARATKRVPAATARDVRVEDAPPYTVLLAAAALALSGFAAMGMEILWFRHATIALGGFRAVYALLLTIILAGIGAGALAGGALHRRTRRPAAWLMAAQALFVATTLLGMAATDVRTFAATAQGVERAAAGAPALARATAELWFNARPILLEVGVPALLMGFAFPLANAVVQRAESLVGARAGVLYLANTAGAVCGAISAGFLLLPALGLQRSTAVVAVAAWLAIVPLYAAARRIARLTHAPAPRSMLAASLLVGAIALASWLTLPSDFLARRALIRPTGDERLLTLSEGVNELIAVTEDRRGRRWLLTNGHPMSSTGRIDQRYMRALAHVPLLSMAEPRSVLVIGFGVGNTVHAATLHPSVRRIEVADLSRHVLDHASFFEAVNHGVLHDPRVAVYVNDGRQHLLMQRPSSYDLITLEPPPIAHAGVGALYSREFYALARSRLSPGGYISQWLPAYQVPADAALAMIRAFIEVFPEAVLLSGGQPSLQLIGLNGAPVAIEPVTLSARLGAAPEVAADLRRVDLGTFREMAGMFLGGPRTLRSATVNALVATDDRPIQEYSVGSLLNFGLGGVPAAAVDLGRVADWCRGCFEDGRPVPLAADLDAYLGLMARAYMVESPFDVDFAEPRYQRLIQQSEYVRDVLRDAGTVRNQLGVQLAAQGRLEEAIAQFREALLLYPELAAARRNLRAVQEAGGQRR